MSKLFDRYLKITTTGQFNVSLEDLHCKIVVSGAETGAPNRCDVNIYNISQQTVSSIKAGDKITIDAGYKDLHGVIFEGEILYTRYGIVNVVDTYLNLQCNNLNINNKMIAQTLSKNESISSLVKAVSDKVGLVGIEGLNYIPRDQYIRSKPIFGTAQDILNDVAKSNGLYIMFNGDKYSIFDINNLLAAKTTILNKDTGLISRQMITHQVVEGRCLINPNIKVGSMVQIMQSSIDEFKADLAKNFTDKEKKLIDGIAYQVREECFDPYERSIYTRQYTFNDINGNILHVNTTPSEKRIITATEKDIVDIMIINQVMHYYQLKN